MSRALGRYELLRPLARGGMGEVYLARRRAAGVEKWLVVKRMRPERAGDARFLELFMREARLSMSLAHQNIVPVFDFGRIDDQVFLAMERVEGKDLGSSLARAGKPLSPLLAAFITAECCKALDYAHRRKSPEGTDLGIVHRDVTPRNVLLSWSGEVKLTDFGIASLAGDEPSKMAGTPAYMAPEQARSEAIDVRADIYAVGIVLREALTGVRPRRGDDRAAVLAAAQLGTLDPWPDGFESPLRAIVDRATAVAKDDRFADARSMLAELDGYIVSERAGNKGEAPERQLATWLAEVWAGARDEDVIDGPIEANQLLSFIDDGLFDVAGTGTQRSMALTAADDGGDRDNAGNREITDGAPVQPTRWRWLAWIASAGIAAALAIGFVLARSSEPPTSAPSLAVANAGDAPIAEAAGSAAAGFDASVAVEPALPVDAPTGSTVDALATDPPPHRAQVRPVEHKPKPNQAPTPPAVVAKSKVFINTVPWSYFTIDDDATQYQTAKSLRLTPGPHKIHFTGNEFHPSDKTVSFTVPDNDELKLVEKL